MSGRVQLKWDPKNLEIRSRSVEQQLQPLITQVTTLLNTEKVIKKGRGKSKKASVLVAAVEKAIENFIEKGEQIAKENPEIGEDMLGVVEEIRSAGDTMSIASRDFAGNPCDSIKRTEMVKAARVLLGAVTRLLILADMIDIQLLMKSVESIEASLEKLRTSPNHDQLMEELKNYTQKSRDLLNQAGRRQQEVNDPQLRDDLAAARAVLKKSSTMLLSASKAYVSHPDIPAAKANKDDLLKQICEAVDTIGDVALGKTPKRGTGSLERGKLATNIESLENAKPLDYKDVRTKALLQQQLDELINGAMRISDSAYVKDERKDKILAGCNAVREAMQNLLTQSMQKPEDIDDVTKKAKHLQRQLRKALADKISDSFLSDSPLINLARAAEKGDVQEVETCAPIFSDHCNKLIEVAGQVCELSNNEEGVKMVRYAAAQLASLSTGVINAARILAAQPESKIARDNMDAFKQSWENQVKLLLEAVDDISTIDDVLSVLDNHVYDDMNQYVAAVRERDPDRIAEIAQNIRGRASRICGIVDSEMDNYEPCIYTMKVLEAVKALNKDIEDFNTKTEEIIQIMITSPDQEIDENEFIDSTRLVYDGVRDVRRAVLMNRADEELDPEEVELEDTYTTYTTNTLIRTVTETTEVTTTEENSEDMGGITVARQAMNRLPQKEKSKILEQVENFQTEKVTFDREVAKWDDSGNDIVVLAKYMCMIMIQMTDFVRGRGPLKSTTDVINAAKKISETGTKLDQLTRQIADQCPESSTKKDLLAYLERVQLYSHQINIIAKVKTDVENNTNEELIVAGVESATSLIENAKNLMNAVVLTVKASYVASTKYSRQGQVASPIVVWKMRAPEKKPLVRIEKRKEIRAVIRKASQRKPQNPISVLAEFQSI